MHGLIRVACLGVLLGTGATWADILFLDGNTGNLNDDNVLFNGAGDISGPGTLVRGHLNQSPATHVDFTSTGVLSTPAIGQARIAGSPTFSDLSIFLSVPPGGTYTSLIFNIDAVANGNLTVQAIEGNGQVNTATSAGLMIDPLSQNGQNFYTVVAINGQDIRQVNISTTVGVSDIAQIRIGKDPLAAVPEPTSVLLLLTLFAGISPLIKRKYQGRFLLSR